MTGIWKYAALAACLLLLLAGVAGLAAWRGYDHGYDTAQAKGNAQVAALDAAQAEASALASDAARRALDAEIVRRDRLQSELAAALKTISAQRREITRERIAHAARDTFAGEQNWTSRQRRPEGEGQEGPSHVAPAPADVGCLLGPDWLRLYNEALGLGHAAEPVPAASSDAAGSPAGPGTADVGLLREAAVTPADVLAHARDMGAYTRELRAKLETLGAWAQGRQP